MELFEALCRCNIPSAPRQFFDFIIRKTYGYQKVKDQISTSQIISATGLCRRSIENARSWLRTNKMITTSIQGDNPFLFYQIQKDYENWDCYKKPELSIGTTTTKSCGTESKGGQVPHRMVGKYHQTMRSTIDNRQKKITRTRASNNNFNLNLKKEIVDLKKLKWDQHKIKQHFLMREIPEADIDKAMGKHF